MIKPILDNVVVQKENTEAKTDSGIFVPDSDDNKLRVVTAVGPNVPDDVKVGDTVLLTTQTHRDILSEFEVVKYVHILGVINKD